MPFPIRQHHFFLLLLSLLILHYIIHTNKHNQAYIKSRLSLFPSPIHQILLRFYYYYSLQSPTMSSSEMQSQPRNKTLSFLQNLRTSTIGNAMSSPPSPTTATNSVDNGSFVPRSARFSGTFDDLRKSISAFSIRSSDSDSIHHYDYSRWSTVSSTTSAARQSIFSVFEDTDSEQYRKHASMSASRREAEIRREIWAEQRRERERCIAEALQEREERRKANARADPKFESALEKADSNLVVQSMFLRPLAMQANKLVTGAGAPGTPPIADMEDARDNHSIMTKETTEALMSLL